MPFKPEDTKDVVDIINSGSIIFFYYLKIFSVAILAGTASYLYRINGSKEKFKPLSYVTEICLSIFLAYITINFCFEYKLSTYMTSMLVGLSSFFASKLIVVIEALVKKYFAEKIMSIVNNKDKLSEEEIKQIAEVVNDITDKKEKGVE